MAITVLFFGQLAEIAGGGELTVGETGGLNGQFPGPGDTSTKELKAMLLERFPRLADIVFNIAVDTVIIDGDVALKPGSSVAFLPPFSGG
ncbi:MoaD/ThiS family protein [Flavitalea antarctica]